MSSAHPPDPTARSDINSFVQNLRHAGKVKGTAPSSISQPKSSLSDAKLETNAGLRPKGQKHKMTQTRTDREPEGSSKQSRVEESQLKAMKEKLGKKIPIQKLVFLPDGIICRILTAMTTSHPSELLRTYVKGLLGLFFCISKIPLRGVEGAREEAKNHVIMALPHLGTTGVSALHHHHLSSTSCCSACEGNYVQADIASTATATKIVSQFAANSI
ncbi:hypothetical protein DFH07DRAFT_779927 [Mycena maculata]|uniref:Uncharacterized protein n=1 Tax=Mycena maculata TaxID=230809 RepID=A0AAD7MWS0_9AGAR|nr:hypothetical protein DFH07DRAFT_779927 [Mycena maculata]